MARHQRAVLVSAASNTTRPLLICRPAWFSCRLWTRVCQLRTMQGAARPVPVSSMTDALLTRRASRLATNSSETAAEDSQTTKVNLLYWNYKSAYQRIAGKVARLVSEASHSMPPTQTCMCDCCRCCRQGPGAERMTENK